MAFLKKNCVFKGNPGEKLSCHKSPKEAREQMNRLHKKNKPKSSNRGKSAAKKNRKK